MVDRHCTLAQYIAEGLRASGYQILNRVLLNQILIRAATNEDTAAILRASQNSGEF